MSADDPDLTSLRARRLERGLSQAELADQVGVTQQAVGAWERGVSRPRGTRLASLAAALGTSPHNLSILLDSTREHTRSHGDRAASVNPRIDRLERDVEDLRAQLSTALELLRLEQEKVRVLLSDEDDRTKSRKINDLAVDQLVQTQTPSTIPNH
jgi:transcriptional regulator with XRE-family HTH domain